MKKVLLSLILAIVCIPMAIGQATTTAVNVIDTTVCSAYKWIDSVTYTKDTVAMFTDTATNTVYVLNLTVQSPVADTAEAIALNGTCRVLWNNEYLYQAGEFIDTLKTADGCDSLVKVAVTLSGFGDTTLSVTNCGSYTASWGETLATSGVYMKTDSNACLNITLNLTVNSANTDTTGMVVEDVNAGCYYKFYDQIITDTNTVHYAMDTNRFGCDSVVAIRVVSYTGTQNDTTVVNYCGTSYKWNLINKTYTTAGNYDTIIVNADSTCTMNYRLELTFGENDSLIVAGPYCAQHSYNFRHSDNTSQNYKPTYDSTGIYSYNDDPNLYVYNPLTGCISHLTIDLTIWQPERRERDYIVDTTVCDEFTFWVDSRINNSKKYTTDTVVTHVYEKRTNNKISNYKSCYDSVGTLQLHVKYKSYNDTNVTACDFFYWDFDQQTYTSSTTQTKTIDGIKNHVGCDSVGRLKLTINKSPNVQISGDWMLEPGDTTILRAVADMSNLSYRWFENDVASGTKDTLLVVAPANGNNVNIKLISTTNKHCSDTTWMVVTSNNMGIDDAEGANVSIFPNPASRFVTINSSSVISQVVVYNAIGQQVMLRNEHSNKVQLDLARLAAGSYIMRILTSDGAELNRKLIVSK